MANYKSEFNSIRKVLKINNIISVRFVNAKPGYYKQYQDTACTALARSLKNKKYVFIDRKYGQLCSGGNYFLNITNSPKKEICDIYIKDEKVFNNNKVCLSFLNKVSNCPKIKRYILFSPLEGETKKPDIVIMLVKPSQASRLLGLSVFKKMNYPSIIPAAPTCLSIYEPLLSNKIHLNFIDYYDRYFQGKMNKKYIWEENEMIISLTFAQFHKILENFDKSSQGAFKRINVRIQKVDNL